MFEGMPYTEQNLTQLLSTKEARACLLDFIAHTAQCLQSVDTDGYNKDDEGGGGGSDKESTCSSDNNKEDGYC